MIQKELKAITFSDGISNQLSFFKNNTTSTKTIFFLPALGVKAAYYDKFATNLVAIGCNVVTMDWRGLGHSSVRASRKVDFGYKELITDIDESIDFIHQEIADTSIILAGHSLGGQLGALLLCKKPTRAIGLIAIASCSVYYKGWTGLGRLPLFFAGLLFNPISNILGYFPGKKLGFGGTEFKTVMLDWGDTLKTGKYRPKNDDFNYELAMPDANFPILAISIEHDTMAPHKAVEYLLKKYPNSPTKHLVIKNSDKKLNHFRWAKKPDTVTKLIIKEIDALILN